MSVQLTRRSMLFSLMGMVALGAFRPSWALAASNLSADEWKARLTDEQFRILREHGTEKPFSSPLNDEKREGVYHCAGCDTALFASAMKFDSGTGWPSFFDSLPDVLGTSTDSSFLMTRTEYHCATCKGHHGHVFDDGPQPTGLRYCNNGVALVFKPSA